MTISKYMYRTLVILFFSLVTIVSASANEMSQLNAAVFQPKIDVLGEFQTKVPVATPVELSAQNSVVLPDEPVEYVWKVDGEVKERSGERIRVSFPNIGAFAVTLTVVQGDVEEKLTKSFEVYNRKIAVITDDYSLAERYENFAIVAGVHLEYVYIHPSEATRERLGALAGSIVEEDISQMIVALESRESTVEFLEAFWAAVGKERVIESVVLTDDSIRVQSPFYRRLLQKNEVHRLFVSRYEGVYSFLAGDTLDRIRDDLVDRTVDYAELTPEAVSPIFILSYITSRLLDVGYSESLLYILLSFSIIVFFLVLTRQVVGISTHGVFVPAMMVIAMMQFGLLSTAGIVFAFMVASLLLRWFLEHIIMLYIPRNGFFFSSLGFVLLVALLFLPSASISFSAAGIVVFFVLMQFADKFQIGVSEDGIVVALSDTIKTVGTAAIIALFISIPLVKHIVLSYPEIVVFPYVGILMLGKYSGLRLTEYWKFSDMAKSEEVQSSQEIEQEE